MPTELTAGRIEALVSVVDDTTLTAGRIEALAAPIGDMALTAGRIEVLSREAFLLTAARVEALVIPPEPLVSCANSPDSYFIVPDLLLVGESNVVSVTSEQGPYPGASAAGDDNLGRLLPLQSGRLTTSAESVAYRLQRAGGVDKAEFIWRRQSDTATDFNGADDPRRFKWWHAPTSDSTPGSDNCTTVFASAWRRLVNITIDAATDTATVSYRDVDTDRYDGWTTTTFTLEQSMPSGADHGAAAVELPDGKLLLMVSIPWGASADFDAYTSADGGLTWERTARGVIQRSGARASAVGARNDSSQIRMARSGEHIRLTWVETSGPTIYSIHSTDRGSTWSFLGGAQVPTSTGTTDDPYAYDIVAINDTGLFMMVRGAATQTRPIWRFAQGDADFTLYAGSGTAQLQALPQNVYQIVCVRTASWVYVWMYWSDAGTAADDGWTFARVRPAEATSTDPNDYEINDNDDPTWRPSGALYTPTRVTAVWMGDGVWFLGGRKNESTGVDINRALGWYWGGWTRYSLGLEPPTYSWPSFNAVINEGSLWNDLWHVGQGQPSQGAGSAWTQNTTGTGTDNLTMQWLEISGSAAADARNYSKTVFSGNLLGGACIYWVVRLDTGDSTTTADDVAVRVKADDGAASSVDLSVRHGPSSLVLYDNAGTATLATLNITGGIDTGSAGKFFEVRLWIKRDGSTNYAQLLVLDTDTGEWFVTAVTNPTDGATVGADTVEFGHLGQVQATTMRSWWREFGVSQVGGTAANMSVGTTGFTNPDDLWGFPASSRPTSIEHGLEVAWGGSGGVEGDGFDGAVERQHPAGAITLASPRLDWRSEPPLAAATIILDADSINGLDEWTHDAIAMFGTNSRNILVDYDDDVAFGSPTSVETLDTTAFGGASFTVDSVAGAIIVANSSTLAWVMGECEGLYIRMTSGTAIGLTFKVTSHRGLAVLHCGEETTSLTSQGVAVSDTFVLFRDHAALEYTTPIGQGGGTGPQRYMRIRFTDTDTAEGDHRLGTLVVGSKLSISVPLDWSMTDNSQPNVTKYRTRSAVSWRYAEGPVQRTLTGRIVGDANRFRDRLRYVLSQIDYEARPVVLVRDDEQPDVAMLGRVTSGNQQDDVAWYRDSAGTLRSAGDVSLVFEEEV